MLRFDWRLRRRVEEVEEEDEDGDDESKSDEFVSSSPDEALSVEDMLRLRRELLFLLSLVLFFVRLPLARVFRLPRSLSLQR